MKKNLMIMIENGLPEDAALAALTTNPASILGISNIAGTVDAGKMANLVVSTAPFFTEDAAIKYVFADGDMYEYEIKAKKSNGNTEGLVALVGSWTVTIDTDGGELTGAITISENNGDYEGTMSLSVIPTPGSISDLSIDGQEVSFTVSFEVQGQGFDVEVTGTLDGDTMDGSIESPQGPANFTAEKDPNN